MAIEIRGELDNIGGSLVDCIFSFGSVSGKASKVGLLEARLAGLADRLTASFVLVVGRHVAHALGEA